MREMKLTKDDIVNFFSILWMVIMADEERYSAVSEAYKVMDDLSLRFLDGLDHSDYNLQEIESGLIGLDVLVVYRMRQTADRKALRDLEYAFSEQFLTSIRMIILMDEVYHTMDEVIYEDLKRKGRNIREINDSENWYEDEHHGANRFEIRCLEDLIGEQPEFDEFMGRRVRHTL